MRGKVTVANGVDVSGVSGVARGVRGAAVKGRSCVSIVCWEPNNGSLFTKPTSSSELTFTCAFFPRNVTTDH